MPRKEYEIQEVCVAWFRLRYPKFKRMLYASLNGVLLNVSSSRKLAHLSESARRAIAWNRLEKQGAVPGVFDLFLSIPSGDYAGLYIDTKTKKGRLSDSQKEFLADAKNFGYACAIVRSLDDFQKLIEGYLNESPQGLL